MYCLNSKMVYVGDVSPAQSARTQRPEKHRKTFRSPRANSGYAKMIIAFANPPAKAVY